MKNIAYFLRMSKSHPHPGGCQLIVLVLLILFHLATPGVGVANNIAIENGTLTDQDTGADTYDIEFDISWDNSWYIAGAPSLVANWDAAWVFAKYSVYDSGSSTWGDWTHCVLLNTGSVAPAGSQIDVADNEGGGTYYGAFIYRDAAGTGSNDWDNVQLRWDYGADTIADNATVKIKVFGIEMVYIPQGEFYVGDTDNGNTNCFFTADGSYAKDEALGPYQISSEGAISVGTTSGYLYYDEDNTYDGDGTGPIPADFPKGYDDFYIMKYEVTNQQYADFLNTLTRTQQENRVESFAADTFAMNSCPDGTDPENCVTDTWYCRSAIRNPSSIPAGVITFGCDLDNDKTFNEATDGQWIAANHVSWMDLAAYADWAGLRPFTELEFEKAARGGQAVVEDEFAWGSTTLEAATGTISNIGEAGEVPNQGNMNYSSVSPDGPFRVGSYADATSTRTNSGGSYFGVMDLSGNLWEFSVTVGTTGGREFTGTHGDGDLSANGFATNADWPGYDGDDVTTNDGSGRRGGSWFNSSTYARVSDRVFAADTNTSRNSNNGVRCARTSP